MLFGALAGVHRDDAWRALGQDDRALGNAYGGAYVVHGGRQRFGADDQLGLDVVFAAHLGDVQLLRVESLVLDQLLHLQVLELLVVGHLEGGRYVFARRAEGDARHGDRNSLSAWKQY